MKLLLSQGSACCECTYNHFCFYMSDFQQVDITYDKLAYKTQLQSSSKSSAQS
jgi:hypothetical protein